MFCRQAGGTTQRHYIVERNAILFLTVCDDFGFCASFACERARN